MLKIQFSFRYKFLQEFYNKTKTDGFTRQLFELFFWPETSGFTRRTAIVKTLRS